MNFLKKLFGTRTAEVSPPEAPASTIAAEFPACPGFRGRGKGRQETQSMVAFVGDGNNVARSLAIACGKVGGKLVLARPDGYGFDADFAAKYAKCVGGPLPEETADPVAAVKHADVIYTDVWTSMGQETEREHRLNKFAPYQVNADLARQSAAPRQGPALPAGPSRRGDHRRRDRKSRQRRLPAGRQSLASAESGAGVTAEVTEPSFVLTRAAA